MRIIRETQTFGKISHQQNTCFRRASPAKENSSCASAEGASRKILEFGFNIQENKPKIH